MQPVKINVDPKSWVKTLNKLPWKSPKMIGGALATLLVLGGGGYYLNTTAPAAYVVVNGETVGIVESVGSGEELLEQILEEEGAAFGEAAQIHDQIEFNTARIDNGYTPLSKEELKGKLSFFIEAVELKIADHSMFTLADQKEADELLKAYQEMYVKEDENNKLTSVAFEEEIKTQDVEALPEEITTVEKALEVLKQGNVQKEEYVVEEN
ncbi:MAG TPA: metalloendopeptidase, partial [Desulfitobacterium dehalogenans]|nr:metalloendopeptidase [Desulfitobacterium dehalogenans]